jgi:hypothetical protein
MMNKVNLFIIEIDLGSFLGKRIWDSSGRKAKLWMRFRLLQKKFHYLFIYMIIKFRHKNIATHGLIGSNAIPYKIIKESNILIIKQHRLLF